jgi:hypothetical protein
MQNEITTPGPLLNENGSLVQKGWSRHPLLQYDRNSIKAGSLRIKEWDYYCILKPEYGIALTIADNSYMGLYAINFYDFDHKTELTGMVIDPFTMGKLKMPMSSSTGDNKHDHSKIRMHFLHRDDKRILHFNFPGFNKGKGIQGEISLEEMNKDSMVIATPFSEDNHAFYYNQKINCLAASGKFYIGEKEFTFDPSDSFGVLDWGRGVWTYRNNWYWGSASGLLDGAPFGFNIGYGFGDTSAATENMLLYKGIAHKLEQVSFHINKKDYLKPWKFSSNDGRFELDFVPAIDRYSNTNLLLLKSKQHQVFGYFTGTVILDDGTPLTITNFLGFAEYVENKW